MIRNCYIRHNPEVFVYGKILSAEEINFRYIGGKMLDNATVENYLPDLREDFVLDKINNLWR